MRLQIYKNQTGFVSFTGGMFSPKSSEISLLADRMS